MKQITVIGAGFAGLSAAKRLRQKDPAAEITLIAPEAEFVYYPGLIWIPPGLASGDELRVPLDGFFRKQRIRFHKGRVTGLAEGGRVVKTDAGDVRNDALLIASGGRFLRKTPGIEHALTICEGIKSAEAIRDRLKALGGGTIAVGFGSNPKEPSAMRGGPMFEVLFGLDTLLRRQGRRDKFRLVFFNAATEPGKRLGARAVEGLLREMAQRGIETRLGHKITGFEASLVKTEGGDIPADLILFMPGLTGPAWVEDSGLPLSEGGMIRADRHCRVEGTSAVYVAGDAGSYPGPDWLPKQAHVADLQAVAAADNILGELAGRAATVTFRPELICIVDTLDKGILVFRNEQRAFVFPARLLHWTKRAFERLYMRRYR